MENAKTRGNRFTSMQQVALLYRYNKKLMSLSLPLKRESLEIYTSPTTPNIFLDSFEKKFDCDTKSLLNFYPKMKRHE